MSKKTAISPTRAEDFSEWYQQVVYSADLAEHSPVRGCMIIKPWGYALWERMQALLDKQFKLRNVSNIYCPLLIPLEFLEKEAQHIAGFAKECAVVTHHRLETNEEGKLVPASPLAEPYVIRPTSEAMMGHMFAKWVQSYRDLPLLVNQWANVMRWEMRPRLFLRTSEFLWQEGHTVHADAKGAQLMAEDMIHCYQSFFETILAIPVIRGEKSELERFSGADKTWTIESLMQDGKALQSGTSHFLAQYFSKAFDIGFSDASGVRQLAWTTSWGVTTRMIGALVMSHGDDDGLVLPPALSPYQVVIIPVIHKDSDKEKVMEFIQTIQEQLSHLSIYNEPVRVHVDTRDMAGGDKKWSWVKRGVPVRIEIGARDCASGQLMLHRRDTHEKMNVTSDELNDAVVGLLLDMQKSIFSNALERSRGQIKRVESPEECRSILQSPEDGVAYLVPWAGSNQDEEALGARQLTIRCILPHDHAWVDAEANMLCVASLVKCDTWALIAKSY